MRSIIRSFVPLGLAIAFVSTLLLSASAIALSPIETIVLEDDTPECLVVWSSNGHLHVFNSCTVDVTFTPVEGACTNCTEVVVFPANFANGLWGACGVNNSYHWSMPGEDPEMVDEGILEWNRMCGTTGLGCSAAPSANGSSAVLMLMLLGLLVMCRRPSGRRVHSD